MNFSNPNLLPPNLKQQFAQKLSDELDKITMSWDNILRLWHPVAISALAYTSPNKLQIQQSKWKNLFETNTHGVNMNIITALCNNIEERTPAEMQVTARDWSATLDMNERIAIRWQALVDPVQSRILKEMELMHTGSKSKIIAQA